jgi:hypothetical protein
VIVTKPATSDVPAHAAFGAVERGALWLVAAASASFAIAWIAFQVQQDQIAPVVLFPLAVGTVLGATLVGLRRWLGAPSRGATCAAALVLGLLVVAGQDYIGHRQRLRTWQAEIRREAPLASLVAGDTALEPTLVDHLRARLESQPVWWTLDFVLTAAAAGLVAALGTRPRRAASDDNQRTGEP